MAGQKPRLLPGEPKLGMPTVRARFQVTGESLPAASRVNYFKLVTVEHNTRVLILGSVLDSDCHHLFDSVNLCWEQKSFHRTKPTEERLEGR